MKKLLLVDGSSYLFRAYHTPALSNMITSNGEPSGTIFGFNRSLNQFIEYLTPDYCCVVFDPRGKTQRNKIFPQYKANRPPTPPEIVKAYQKVTELMELRGIFCLQIDQEEADDVIGSLCEKFEPSVDEIYIATGDKDLAQLVTDKTFLINSKNNQLLTYHKKEVREKFGVWPNQIIEYLALTGDSVDNIPGVPGVGAKRAAQLLNDYDNIENLIKNLSLIKGKLGENLQQNKNNIPLSIKLTTINKHIKTTIQLSDLATTNPNQNKDQLKDFYVEMGFLSELNKLNQATVVHKPTVPPNQPNLLKESETKTIKELLENLEKTDLPLFFISQQDKINWLDGEQNHQTKTFLTEEEKDLLNQQGRTIVTYDWKQQIKTLNLKTFPDKSDDLMLMNDILNAGKSTSGIKNLIRLNLEEEPIDTEQLHILDLAKIYRTLKNKLNQTPESQKIYNDLEKPVTEVLVEMEKNGVLIDKKTLETTDQELSREISEIQQKIYEITEEPFNLDSPQQVGKVLYEKLNLPILKKTSTGKPSTNEEILHELAQNGHHIAEQILQYRGLAKLQSTYTKGLQKHLDPNDRIHTTLNQMGASTGRLSSSEPNLQNIPIKTVRGRQIRQCFIAPQGFSLVAADYSQIELRILAHQAEDPGLLKAFNERQDIHQVTATKVFNIDLNKVDETQRRYAKTINFGLIYGMSAFSLAKQLKSSVAEAKQWVANYFAEFPNIKQYMEETKKTARENGFVKTMMGRTIHITEINSRNHALRNYAERAAINAPIQGTAADLIKKAMIEIHQAIKQEESIKMILQIHDELLFEVKNDAIEQHKQQLQDKMERTYPLKVPLLVNIESAKNWAEAH